MRLSYVFSGAMAVVIGLSVGTSGLLLPGFSETPSEKPSSTENHQTTKDEAYFVKKSSILLEQYNGNPTVLILASHYIDEGLAKYPKSSELYNLLASLTLKLGYINEENYEQGTLEQATKYVKKSLELNPKNYDALNRASYIEEMKGNLSKAREYANKLLVLDPKRCDGHLMMADIESRLGHWEAVKERTDYVLSSPDSSRHLATVYDLLVNYHFVKNEKEKSIEYYKKILALNPNSAWTRVNYASFMLSVGQPDEAILWAGKALELMDFGMAHHILSTAYVEKGKQFNSITFDGTRSEAEKLFEEALEHSPANAEALYQLGYIYQMRAKVCKNVGYLNTANTLFNACLSVEPEHFNAKRRLEENRLSRDEILQRKDEGYCLEPEPSKRKFWDHLSQQLDVIETMS